MRNLMKVAVIVAGATLGAATAQAMPIASTGDAGGSLITLAAGGCGPAFHRGPYGGCRPNWRGPGWRRGWRRGPGWHRGWRGHGGWHRHGWGRGHRW